MTNRNLTKILLQDGSTFQPHQYHCPFGWFRAVIFDNWLIRFWNRLCPFFNRAVKAVVRTEKSLFNLFYKNLLIGKRIKIYKKNCWDFNNHSPDTKAEQASLSQPLSWAFKRSRPNYFPAGPSLGRQSCSFTTTRPTRTSSMTSSTSFAKNCPSPSLTSRPPTSRSSRSHLGHSEECSCWWERRRPFQNFLRRSGKYLVKKGWLRRLGESAIWPNLSVNIKYCPFVGYLLLKMGKNEYLAVVLKLDEFLFD